MARTKKDNEEIIEDLKANNKKAKKNETKTDNANKETKEDTKINSFILINATKKAHQKMVGYNNRIN